MHYKNGREARNCDPVVHKIGDTIIAGTLHSTNANSTSCNGQVAVAIPGGIAQHWVTVGDCLHAEDAYNAAATVPAK